MSSERIAEYPDAWPRHAELFPQQRSTSANERENCSG